MRLVQFLNGASLWLDHTVSLSKENVQLQMCFCTLMCGNVARFCHFEVIKILLKLTYLMLLKQDV